MTREDIVVGGVYFLEKTRSFFVVKKIGPTLVDYTTYGENKDDGMPGLSILGDFAEAMTYREKTA